MKLKSLIMQYIYFKKIYFSYLYFNYSKNYSHLLLISSMGLGKFLKIYGHLCIYSKLLNLNEIIKDFFIQ